MTKADRLALSNEALTLLAERFRVLAKPIRLQILQELQSGMKSVSEITRAVRSTQPSVSKHLRVLQDGGLLGRKQKGNTVYYWVLDQATFDLCNLVLKRLTDHLEAKTRILKELK